MDLIINGYHQKEVLYKSRRTLIYRAVRTKDQKSVIIKAFCSEYPRLQELARFKYEIEITGKFQEQGVVRFIEDITIDSNPAMILEDFKGSSLNLLIPDKTLSLYQFLSMAIKIARALGCIHRHNIIHKDINPHNILYNPETKEIQIIDFGISTELSRENLEASMSARLEGTPAYISPEQTGRMNREVEYRSDYYSLGVTFYELLTNTRPFNANDPMEWVHCHIAKVPASPHELNPSIPEMISIIIMKLMAKNAEDRYQSSAGIIRDLEECLRQWEQNEEILIFCPGSRDIPEKFQIPQKLLGREKEIETLVDAFESVAQGGLEYLLVSGYSGVGKSVLIHELYKLIVRQKGYFIDGKIDQFQRDIPYDAFIQTFRSLVKILLSETDERIERWKALLLEAISPNGQVIIDVIPEVEKIIGRQKPAPELGPIETQNRFLLTFKNFIKVFARKEHPLVIFLDDLQWGDTPTLNLIEHLMDKQEMGYFLLIGAFRSNEVDEGHALQLSLNNIQKTLPLRQIFLEPLEEIHVNELLAETVHADRKTAAPLSSLVFEKTRGNPYFVGELLKNLYQEGAFNFDVDRWSWDLEKITQMNVSDNVIEMMIRRLKKYPQETQNILHLAACIGGTFNLITLGMVQEQSLVEIGRSLLPAIQAGMLVPLSVGYRLIHLQAQDPEELNFDVSYKFQHDRVQQAAYALIHEGKQELHLKIARHLQEHTPEENQEETLLEMVRHFNESRELIRTPTEKKNVCRLNLRASKKAKRSSAYEPALRYIKSGVAFLPENPWQTDYELTLSCYLEKGEIEYLNADWDNALATFDEASEHARTLLERCKIAEYKVTLYRMKNDLETALGIGVAALGELGIEIKAFPDESDVGTEITRCNQMLAGKDLDSLFDLPELTDPLKLSAMALLRECFAPAYFLGSNLIAIIGVRMTEITLTDGNSPHSSVGYIFLSSVTLAVIQSDYDSAYKLGLLSLRLNDEKYHVKAYEALILDMWGTFVCPYKKPIPIAREYLMRGYYSGVENGSYQWAGYCAGISLFQSYWGPDTLDEVADRIDKIIPGLRKIDPNMAQYYYAIKAGIHNLREPVSDWSILSADIWPDAQEVLKQCRIQNDLLTLFVDITCRLSLANWFNSENASEYAAQAEQYLAGAPGIYLNPVFHFHQTMAYAANYHRVEATQKELYRKTILENLERFKVLARHCPETYEHHLKLIQAELGRTQNAPMEEVMSYYDQAIESASANRFIQDQALACERASRYFRAKGKEKIAQLYLREAQYSYQQWGAAHKVKLLKEEFPTAFAQLQTSIGETQGNTSTTGGDDIDLLTLIEVYEAITRKLGLEELLMEIMRIALRSVGAEGGLLLVEGAGIAAVATPGAGGDSDINIEKGDAERLGVLAPFVSPAIIRYVQRSGESLLIDNTARETRFELYNSNGRFAKSILCIPILRQGELRATLYVDNSLTTHAFSAERIKILELVCSQAAISLENARIYDRLEELVEQRTQELEKTHKQLLDTAHRAGMAEVASNVLHNVGNALNSAIVPAGLLRENMDSLSLSSLKKLSQLLEKNKENLGDFFTTDKRGQKLPDFIANLNHYLHEERDNMSASLTRLQKSLAHIQEVIRLQQSYAGGLLLEEEIDLALLLEDALSIEDAALTSEKITIIREYTPLMPFKSDRHKLMLILINLLSNARNSMSGVKESEKEIRLILQDNRKGGVIIKIQDRGVGISPRLMAKIFQHGFTTRPTGHGFGLHSAANAAAELGGRLWAESEGPGKGATFILELFAP